MMIEVVVPGVGVPDVPAAIDLVVVAAFEPGRESVTQLREELALSQPGAEDPRHLPVNPHAGLAGRAHALDLEWRLDRHEPADGRASVDELGTGHALP
jgi:hypothetical protein